MIKNCATDNKKSREQRSGREGNGEIEKTHDEDGVEVVRKLGAGGLVTCGLGEMDH